MHLKGGKVKKNKDCSWFEIDGGDLKDIDKFENKAEKRRKTPKKNTRT